MTGAGHTPGPWYACGLGCIENDTSGERRSVHAPDGTPICRMGGNTTSHNDTAANVLLIAAAPELLHYLKALHRHFGAAVKDDPRLGQVEALAALVIAKAEGR